jgi:hypothetical protein
MTRADRPAPGPGPRAVRAPPPAGAASVLVVLELSAALAQALRRELGLVYVESAQALVAAALPSTRVLPFAGAAWRPLSRADVEQGFRAQAERLREAAARIAVRREVRWSMRTVRGELAIAVAGLAAETDLLLLAGALSGFEPARPRGAARARRPVVAVPVVAGASGARALEVATQLAQALAGVVDTSGEAATWPYPGAGDAIRAASARCDLLVLPREGLDPRRLAGLRCPVLLVG